LFTNIYYDEYKGKMHLWELNEQGRIQHIVEDHQIEYYVEDDTKRSHTTDIYGTPVTKKIASSRKSLKELRNSNVKMYESDISEEVKFLHKRYADNDFRPNVNNYKVANIDIEIQSGNEFPEPDDAKYPVNLITIDLIRQDKFITLGLEPYTGDMNTWTNFEYIHCPTEEMLLTRFCDILKKEKVQIITGWNVADFDIKYICNRIENLGIADMACMSPIGRVIKNRKGMFTIPGIAVLCLMELYKKFSYQNQSSYSLNYIGLQEVGEGKLDFEGQINDLWARDWNLFVDYNVQDCVLVRKIEKKRKFIDLVINLCTQTRTPFGKVFSTIAIVEGYMLRYMHREHMVFSDSPFDNDDEEETIEGGYVETHPGFYNFLLSIDATSEYPTLVRMINISPETKVWHPSERDIPNLIKAHTPGLYYRKEQGIIPKIVTDIFNSRKEFKALMELAAENKDRELEEYYDAQQLVRKILINSIYGCLANKFFHFFDLDNAAEITLGGRTAIQYIANCINEYFSKSFPEHADMYYPNTKIKVGDVPNRLVRVIDTDSNYIWFEHVYKMTRSENQSFLDWSLDFEERIFNPFLNRCMDIYAERYNTKNLLFFKREKIILKQYVQAKKKYATLIIANEKKIYKEPTLKITGIEINKSDLCAYSRKKIKVLLEIMFEGDEFCVPNKDKMQEYIRKCYKEFKKQTIEDISAPKGVNDYDGYYKGLKLTLNDGTLVYVKTEKFSSAKKGDPFGKSATIVKKEPFTADMETYISGTPMHNRAAIVYNFIIKSEQLPYMEIFNGTKLKYVFVESKNKYKTNVVGYIGNYPKEFNKIFKIDFNEQFEKQFRAIAQRMFDTLDFGVITLKDSKIVSIIEED
jgi:DNA polymerase elongation subunit (family B)